MDERTQASDSQPGGGRHGLSDLMADDEVAYRPVSVMAVLGAALALASPLALASRWFAIVPAAGALLSWAAARGVQRQPESRTGLGVAIFGLVLSMVVLGAIAVQKPLAASLYNKSARDVAERFVQSLTEGDRITAFELTLAFNNRRPTPELAEVFYQSNDRAKERLAEFTKRNEVVRLTAEDAKPPRPLKSEGAGIVSGSRVASSWTCEVPASGGEGPATLWLRLERPTTSRGGPIAWRVADFGFAPPS